MDGELNILELNSLLENARGEGKDQRLLRRRLTRWADYYRHPDHLGEIFDIMEDIVLPFLKEELKGQPIENIRIDPSGGRAKFLAQSQDIRIVGTVFVKYQSYGDVGDPLRASKPETLRILAYDCHEGTITQGKTWLERNGVTTSHWFGFDDLFQLPRLILGLAKFATTTLRKIPRLAKNVGTLSVTTVVKPAIGIGRVFSMEGLAKLKDALARLADVKVFLGKIVKKEFVGGIAKLTFEEISGWKAIANLFAGKLSDFASLAHHWPYALAKRYVAEIQTLIMDRLKHTKIAQEVANAFAANKMTSELLNKLPQSLRREIKKLIKMRWNTIRNAFWRNVFDDGDLVAELKKIGMTFGKREGAPVLEIGGKRLAITLDHIARKVENPLQAFDPQNLRVLTSKDNSVLKEGLVRNIKELSGLNLDEFNALGINAGRLSKEMADELGRVLDALPNEEDLFRGLGWD